VDHLQIVAAQGQRQGAEPGAEEGPIGRIGGPRGEGVVVAVDPGAVGLAEEPAIALLGLAAEQVELVVAGHRHRQPGVGEVGEELHHANAVGATIDQIAHKDERPLGPPPLGVHPQAAEQGQQGFELAVDIADEVEGAVGQAINEARHGQGSPAP
jgi:hypothetical protein